MPKWCVGCGPTATPPTPTTPGRACTRWPALCDPRRFGLSLSIERGDFLAEYTWNDSAEDEEHIAAFGIGTEAACWMQVGYASGYASAFMGKMIVFREVACQSMGAEACRITAAPTDQWDDAEEDLRYFALETSAQRTRRSIVPTFSEVSRICASLEAAKTG